MPATSSQLAAQGLVGFWPCQEGVAIVDGTMVRCLLGRLPNGQYGLGMFDTYGQTLLTPEGFGPSWAALIQSGIPNNMFQAATPGALPLGASRTDPTGETALLPFWTAWASSGSATVIHDTRHLAMIEVLKDLFKGKQIIATAHSSVIVEKYQPKEHIMDVERISGTNG